VTIAARSISGLHGLVASRTTSKQLNRETISVLVGSSVDWRRAAGIWQQPILVRPLLPSLRLAGDVQRLWSGGVRLR